ncbi:MAG: tRNA (N(6)-L-threonylcarbamoyladenosine(37)-C(2))-methylthiotransferase MtaB [Candidatus Omnitrophica bacterium]|nr:tRNA (N(6)-L-threonylcarbamoyladenosine(37)-C(2))-methylthiotransferase MtaB [Candidatus Omnitrophota bacterium]
MKTVKFYTLGCKVNQYDTQVIREQFINYGFRELDNGLAADICVINTCTVTHRADSDSLNIIRKAIKNNPKAKIIVTGCLTELDAGRIKEIGGVSLIVKNKDRGDLFKQLKGRFRLKRHKEGASAASKGISGFSGRTRAFLKIQDGCNNFCSYCKVPLVRGHSRSRLLEYIVAEARGLVKNGFQEIVLCGICLGAYGRDLNPKADIVDVIEQLENIEGLLRIRLSSIELNDVTDKLIAKLSSSQKLCRHLHIPLQSGDDTVLKKMNRPYTAKDYLEIIRRIKRRIPEIAISTDVIVGFPEEKEAHFKNTAQLIKKISPLKVHVFPYSSREGTAAFRRFRGELDPRLVKDRFERLQKVSQDSSFNYKRRFVGRNMPVLVEGKTREGFWQGYTGNYIRVLFKSGLKLKNKIVAVKLKTIIQDYVSARHAD